MSVPTAQMPFREPHKSRWTGSLARALLIVAVAAAGWWMADSAIGTPRPSSHPAEQAVRQLGKTVIERQVVRADSGQFDVWMFSDAPFKLLLERARFVMTNAVQLRGEFKVEALQVSEHDRSVEARLIGPKPVKVWLSAHLSGSLLVIRGAGSAAEAPPWAPPYRPLPLELPHGPIR